jgi:hypothetical protein
VSLLAASRSRQFAGTGDGRSMISINPDVGF